MRNVFLSLFCFFPHSYPALFCMKTNNSKRNGCISSRTGTSRRRGAADDRAVKAAELSWPADKRTGAPRRVHLREYPRASHSSTSISPLPFLFPSPLMCNRTQEEKMEWTYIIRARPSALSRARGAPLKPSKPTLPVKRKRTFTVLQVCSVQGPSSEPTPRWAPFTFGCLYLWKIHPFPSPPPPTTPSPPSLPLQPGRINHCTPGG